MEEYNNEKEKRDSMSSDLVLIESKDFAQVVFDDVRDEYTESSPLECEFSLNELLAASETDWIGIYKVGFSSHRDFISKVDIDFKGLDNNHGKVTFPADKLPRDDGEFYQFVYVSENKQMRGASVPFQFKKARLSDYVEVEEQEAIVYKSKESAINDTLTEIRSRCIHLTQANETYERLIRENEELIACLKTEMSALKTRCLHLTLENEKINNTLRSKVESFTNLTDKIASLTEENARLQDKFDSISGENRNLLDSLQTRIDQVAQLKSELESVKLNKDHFENILYVKEDELLQLKKDKDELSQIADDLKRINEQIVKLERQVDERVEELTKIKLELKRNEAIVVEQAQTIHNILAERDNLYSVIEKLTKEKSALECNQENLSQELNMSKDKLLAAEQCKELLRAQLVAITEELNEAVAKVSEQACTIDELRTRQTSNNLERETLISKLRSENQSLEGELKQSHGAYHCLKLAHAHLEARIKTSEASRLRHEKEHNQTLEKLREENEELKERIKAGAKEYSKLFDKYRLIRNQQLNMDVYHDLNGDVVLSARRHSATHNNNAVTYSSTNNTNPNTTNFLFDRFFNSSMLSNEGQQFDSDSAIQVIEHFFAKINKETTTTVKSSASTTAASTSASASASANNDNESENKLWEELIAASIAARQMQKLQLQQQEQQQKTEEEQKQQQITTPMKSSPSSPVSFQSAANSTTGSPTMVPQNSTGDSFSRSKLNDVNAAASVDDGLLIATKVVRSSSLTEEKNLVEKTDDFVLSKEKTNVLRMELKHRSGGKIEPSGNCDICDYIFPSNSTVEDIEKHYQQHYGPSCPVCFLTFRKGYPQHEYENHVQSHFAGSD